MYNDFERIDMMEKKLYKSIFMKTVNAINNITQNETE